MVQYLRYNVLVSTMTMGMYKLGENSSMLTRVVYKFLRILCSVCLFSGLSLTTVNIFKRGVTEIDKMAVEIMTMVIFFSALFRTNYFYFFEDNLEKVVGTINDTSKNKTTTGLEEKTLDKHDKITKVFVILWSFSVFFTGQFMALLPLTVIRKVGRVLPLPLWYPFDWKQSPYYELTYFTQAVSQFFMVFSYGNSDMFFCCATIILTAQFTLFGWELENLIYTVLLKQGIPKELVLEFRDRLGKEDLEINKEILEVMASEKFKRDLNKALVESVNQHRALLDACNRMQDFFSPVLLPEILLGIFYCIFIMYSIVVMSNEVSKVVTLVEYLAMYYAHIFCITYLGQQLFDESEILLDKAYNIPWYLCDETFKRMLNIVQARLTRPVLITAWKFFDMKLTTFIFAMKSSFSFLAFLRQVTEAKN